LLIIISSCHAQELVQVPHEASTLKSNEQLFINKSLNDLLREIEPEIKFVLGKCRSSSYFTFRFKTRDGLNNKMTTSSPVGSNVYVKGTLNWNFDKRPKGKEYLWTKNYVEKHGNLAVIRIKVIGKY